MIERKQEENVSTNTIVRRKKFEYNHLNFKKKLFKILVVDIICLNKNNAPTSEINLHTYVITILIS